jgi:hypothetical protein
VRGSNTIKMSTVQQGKGECKSVTTIWTVGLGSLLSQKVISNR